MRRLSQLVLSISLGLAGGIFVQTAPVQACGGFFCSLQAPVDQAGERILFAQDGDEMVAHVQIQYVGPSENFSWVVPVPSPPKLGVGSDELFTTLRNTTRPNFNLNLRTEGQCKEDANLFFAPAAPTQASAALEDEAGGVEVISQEEVGPFETAVIQSDDPQAVKAWLKDNGYDVPDNLQPLLDPYVEAKMYFLALKLKKDRGTGDLQPIVMRYKSEKPMIPIKLTAVAATDDMDVYVWILGKNRAIPTNYRHAEINEALINWQSRGSNYRQVVIAALDESGGRGFVTDYAGDSSAVTLDTLNPEDINLSALNGLNDPLAFANQIRYGSYFPPGPSQGDQIQAFLTRYIPKPQALSSVEDTFFYANLEQFSQALKDAEVVVDTGKAMAELRETRVEPLEEIQTLFKNHSYMTGLYSTLSPQEMTEDPVFEFNPDLPKVSNQREAEGVIQCTRDKYQWEAPLKITLKNGVSYWVEQQGRGGGGSGGSLPGNLPAAAQIQQLSASGAPQIVKNQEEAIANALADRTLSFGGGIPTISETPVEGWGCSCAPPNAAGEPTPLSKGANEGLTYGLALMGFLGWRQWKRKR